MIRFAAPAALWLLAVLPLIILLYMLRARRELMPVSSVLLWRRTRHELATQLPIRRLERSLLLLLQLLAIGAAILALAQPSIRLAAATGEGTVIVVDLSASMQATDVPPSRFGAVRARVMDLVRSTQGPFMIIGARARPTIEASWGDGGSVISVLNRLRPTDGPAALDEAIGLALAQRSPGRNTRPRVIVLTDGASIRPLQPRAGVQFVTAGTRSQNVGIVRLSAEPAPTGTHVVTHIRNTGPRTLEVPLTILVDGRGAVTRRIVLPGGATSVSTALVKGEGTIKAEVAVRDALVLDNAAYALAGTRRPRVLVVGAPDRALDEALAAIGARRVTAARITRDVLEQADVIILNATDPVQLLPGNYLLIGTVAPNLPLTVEGTVRSPSITRWSHGHRVLRYVDLEPVQISEMLRFRPSGGDVLAEGEAPLIWAFTGRGIRAVVLSFTLAQTDLALHPAFPILLSNTLEWLAGSASMIEVGQSVTVSAGSRRDTRLADPEGRIRTITARDGVFSLPAFDRAGIYTLMVGSQRRQFAVNVPPAETDIAPVTPVAASTPGTSGAGTDRMVAIWPFLISAGLALLMIEWVLWLRTLPKAPWRRQTSASTRVARVTGA